MRFFTLISFVSGFGDIKTSSLSECLGAMGDIVALYIVSYLLEALLRHDPGFLKLDTTMKTKAFIKHLDDL